MGRGMPPQQFGMPPQGYMPQPPQMMGGGYGRGMPPQNGMHYQPPPHGMQHRPPQHGGPPGGPPRHGGPPQHHPGMPQMPHHPGMMPPQIQQQPISNDAKVDVVERADHLVHQSSIVKKSSKKNIVRIYDRPGVSMEEMRAQHPKYQLAR